MASLIGSLESVASFEEPSMLRRQSKSDSDTASTDGLTASSQGSLDWCSSVGPLNWADEVEAELTDSGDETSTYEEKKPAEIVEFVQEEFRGRKSTGRNGKTFNNGNTKSTNGRGRPQFCWSDGCAGAVIQLLQDEKPTGTTANLGWEALQRIWNIGPPHLDHAVLTNLSAKPPRSQEHILLSFAAIDLSNVKNLSAYLNCLVKEHDTTRQVCLYFLAGLCTEEKCKWVHPVNTRGWDALQDNWLITYKDFDYTVLNFLCKKTPDEQDTILTSLARMELRGIHNLSAYLSSMIQKHGSYHHSSGLLGRRPDGKRAHQGRHGHGFYCPMSPVASPELLSVSDMPAPDMMSLANSPPSYYTPAYAPHHCMVPAYGSQYMMHPFAGYLGDDTFPAEPAY